MRWVNAHRGVVFLIVVTVLAVSGAWLVRGDRDEGAAASEATATSSTSTLSTSAGDEQAAADGSGSVAESTVPGGSSRLDVPVDPSGSRRHRDEAGARQVAVDYLSTVKQRFLYMAPEAGAALLEAWVADGVAAGEVDDTVARFGQLRDALTAAGGEVWWVVSPLAVKVEAFTPERARVAVWTSTTMASGAAPGIDATVAAPQVAYRTGTVELLWDDTAGWSVWSISETVGPVPMAAPDHPPSGPAEFLTALSGFSLIKEHR